MSTNAINDKHCSIMTERCHFVSIHSLVTMVDSFSWNWSSGWSKSAWWNDFFGRDSESKGILVLHPRFLVGLCKTIVQALRGHVLMIWKCQQPLSWHVVAKDCNSWVAIHPCVVTEKDVIMFRLNGVLFAPCRFWLVVCCSVLRERLIDSLNTLPYH